MVANKALARIRGAGRGRVWCPRDFLDLGTRAAVDQALSRLARKDVVRRVARGLYHYPKLSQRFGMLSPDPNAVASALASSVGARLSPTGALAANMLGISSQVPARLAYLTDGPSRRIKVGAQVIDMRRTAPSRLRWGPVVHALDYLGKTAATDDVVNRLHDRVRAGDAKKLLGDTRFAPGWMKPVLQRITATMEA